MKPQAYFSEIGYANYQECFNQLFWRKNIGLVEDFRSRLWASTETEEKHHQLEELNESLLVVKISTGRFLKHILKIFTTVTKRQIYLSENHFSKLSSNNRLSTFLKSWDIYIEGELAVTTYICDRGVSKEGWNFLNINQIL